MKETNDSTSKVCKVAFFTVLTMAIVLGVAKTDMAEACKDGSSKSGKQCSTGKKSGHSHEGHSKGKHSMPGKSASYVKKILEQAGALKMDDTQISKIGDLYITATGASAAIRAEIEVTINNFKSLYKKGGVTEKAINDYAKKMGELRTRLLQGNLIATFGAKKILTPAQKEKLHESYKSDKKDHGKKHD